MARLRGNRWQADVVVNGRRERRTFPTREQAEQFESDHSTSGTTIGRVFPEFARDLWGGTKDERNCLRIADELVTRLGASMLVSDIDSAEVEDLASSLKADGNKPATVNTKLTRLSKLLKKARKRGMIVSLPDIELNRPQEGRIRFLSEVEEDALRVALPTHYRGLYDFLLYTGCRFGEALSIQWNDITDKTVTFWATKSGKPRTIPLVSTARAGVPWSRHNELIRPFATIPYESFYHSWLKARKAVGLEADRQVVPHVLRHTCASRLVQRGVDIRRVKDWLGHSTIQMTMRYAHLSPSDLFLAAEALESRGQSVNLVPNRMAQ